MVCAEGNSCSNPRTIDICYVCCHAHICDKDMSCQNPCNRRTSLDKSVWHRGGKRDTHTPEASLSKGNCPERDTEEAGLCPPNALLLLLLPQETEVHAVNEPLLGAVNPLILPPVMSAHPGIASCAVASGTVRSSKSKDCDRAQLPRRRCTCAPATDWFCCSAGAVCLCCSASVVAQSQSVDVVREDSSAAVCACSSLVSSRWHCTGISGEATIASLFVTAVSGCPVSDAKLLSAHWTEEMEAMLCLRVGVSEACASHEETLCLCSSACTVGQSESVEAVRVAAAAAGDEADKGKVWGADCIGGRLSAS